MKYYEWFDEWLENYVKPTAKPRTYDRYTYISGIIKCEFGDLEMSQVTPQFLQRFSARLTEMEKSGGGNYSPSTQNLIISVLIGSLRAAATLGYVEFQRYDFLRRPKMSEKAVSCFSRREQVRIEQFIEQNLTPKTFGFLLCLYTGLRLGELLALEWSDINLRDGLIRVTKSVHMGYDSGGNGQRMVGTPKSSSSMRVIPLPKKVSLLLRQVKKMGESQYVVSNAQRPINPRSYQRSFKLMLEYIGVEYRSFHCLRHTFATRALECGIDVKTLSEIMGHRNCSITLNRYTHSLMEHKRRSVLKLDNLFSDSPFR